MAAYGRCTILPYQLEPTSTVADSDSDTTNSISDDGSDSDSSAAMLTENVVDVRAGNTDWGRLVLVPPLRYAYGRIKSIPPA